MNILDQLMDLETSATPGPWIFETNEGWGADATYRILRPNYDELHTICDDERYHNTAPSKANAKLIAAMRNNINQLIAVARAAEGIKRREEIGGYGHEGIPELLKALAALGAK